jgi:hypothetical protein
VRGRPPGAVLSRLLGGLYVDLNREHEISVFLAGSGRSGTTWLSEVINYRDEYRLVFEPFYPEKVRAFESFSRRQYLRPDDRREEYLGPARAALTGALRSCWTDRFHRVFVARRRIVKDIRANLLLGWLRANFPGMPMVLLLRHPCAVVESQLRLGWRDDALDDALAQDALIQDHLHPFESAIRSAQDPFERRVFLWCVENYVPLKQLAPGEIHLAFYERLLTDPEDEFGRLFSSLGREMDNGAFARFQPGHPSPTSRGGTGGNPSVDGWTRSVPEMKVKRTVEILGLFGLDRVYGEGPLPDPEGALGLMAAGGG